MPNPILNQDRPRDDAVPLEFHPCADLFPLMEGRPFDDLKADIEKHGLIEPIVLLDSKILDGRDRYRACTELGIEPSFIPFRGDDPLAFVLSANLHRRHLDAGQRALIAAKLETFRHGGDRKSTDQDATVHVDRTTAAAALDVSTRSVANAAVVLDQGTPELVEAVEAGAIPVSTAADLAREPVEAQRVIIGSMPRDNKGKLTPEAKRIAKAKVKANEAGTDGDEVAPKPSKQHQADIDRLTARIRELERAGSSVDFGRDSADHIGRTIVGCVSEQKARKVAEAIIARLDARRNRTPPKNITLDWQKPH